MVSNNLETSEPCFAISWSVNSSFSCVLFSHDVACISILFTKACMSSRLLSVYHVHCILQGWCNAASFDLTCRRRKLILTLTMVCMAFISICTTVLIFPYAFFSHFIKQIWYRGILYKWNIHIEHMVISVLWKVSNCVQEKILTLFSITW